MGTRSHQETCKCEGKSMRSRKHGGISKVEFLHKAFASHVEALAHARQSRLVAHVRHQGLLREGAGPVFPRPLLATDSTGSLPDLASGPLVKDAS